MQTFGTITMKQFKMGAFSACLLASLMTYGCQSAGTITRGQSPTGEIAQVGHEHGAKKQAIIDATRDAYHSHHNTTTTYGQDVYVATGQGHGPGGCQTGNCPPAYGQQAYGGAGYCPDGNCRSGHGGCPGHGLCRGCSHCGNHLNHYPKHHVSYSFTRPNDLSYPQQGASGGAVVYPYYTHKGPSDFFRKE